MFTNAQQEKDFFSKLKMKSLSSCRKSMQHFVTLSYFKLRSTFIVLLRLNSFCKHICYFLSLSFVGFWVLKALKPGSTDSFRPRDLDLFFTSVSAATISSMSTVEMEVFSNTQLIVLTILMFVGGEVFTSMYRHYCRNFPLKKLWKIHEDKVAAVSSIPRNILCSSSPASNHQIELGSVMTFPDFNNLESGNELTDTQFDSLSDDNEHLKNKSIKFLSFVVLGYILIIHVIGIALVSLYLALVSSAKGVLKSKGLKLLTFSIFTRVSTFASCGFVPTNENMVVFAKNSGLLMILLPQLLFGNTLFPSCLRFSIWVLGKFFKKEESNYLLKNSREIGYLHLLPSLHSCLLVVTVFGFIVVQFLIFCCLEWNSVSLNGLNSFQKIRGVLFEVVNARHTGETILDISIISPATLVLFVAMMYLPPYTSFLPVKVKEDEDEEQHPEIRKKKKSRNNKFMQNLIFSQLSYLLIFIILICITERKKMKQDPLNFNVLNIVVEVISAYGNVGFTTGYSCERQLKADPNCKDKWFGFSGKWSDEGKIILIVVMFFGRLKQFNMDGGKAWKPL